MSIEELEPAVAGPSVGELARFSQWFDVHYKAGLSMTHAMAGGVTHHIWTVPELIEAAR